MITERIINNKFIVDTMNTNFARLKDRQLQILSGANETIRKKFNIPKIADRVMNRTDRASISNGEVTLTQTNLVVLRILDMKKHGNMKIYNRPVWGYIYSEIANELKYGFSKEIKEAIRNELESITSSRH